MLPVRALRYSQHLDRVMVEHVLLDSPGHFHQVIEKRAHRRRVLLAARTLVAQTLINARHDDVEPAEIAGAHRVSCFDKPLRIVFTAQDSQTIRDAFGRAKPNAEYARLYAAAVARRQADQIYNLSLTRTATVILGRGMRRVIGVGRVKTPTLAIVCKRELEIRNFVPLAYFEVVAAARVAGGQFQMRHAPQDRIVRREIAEDVVKAAENFEGVLAVRVEEKRQGPPKLHDLPSLQKLCGSRFGWSASKTLEVAQELYDGQGKKIITYPRVAWPQVHRLRQDMKYPPE
jgi:DNA topoisomerase IA